MSNTTVPVTVLTGFLGSGKTTLLNHILTANHGKRIAVIENEFGEIGVDQDIVIQADEEIFEMNNGCICCTVRGDLIRILGNLMKRRDKFDYILIETTGMADPGPVAQTFFFDEEIKAKTRLDGIVTLVDAKHVHQHWDTNEVKEQIAFADVLLLNKTDLVSPEELDELEARIRHMNKQTKVYRTRQSQIDLDKVLNVAGFSLDKAVEIDPQFLEPEYPFEWGGAYDLPAGNYEFTAKGGEVNSLKACLLPAPSATEAGLREAAKTALKTYDGLGAIRVAGKPLEASGKPQNLKLKEEPTTFPVTITEAGPYALILEHHPHEFHAQLSGLAGVLMPVVKKGFKPHHHHEEEVTSVGIDIPGDLNANKLNKWLADLLQEKGQDIFRMKGVLSLKGDPNRFVFQGVHMTFDGRPDREWGDTPRSNKLVFIGRNLDRKALNEGFAKCLAK
ncbi:CobW family GTP-binding protein [Zavarzinella formosa]|uniref:CobW family GTP-binding protein n=1 Tax=Zavarzinella formosa TaxID=360055 RepID=UPI00036B32B1|nr:GTP-binding protein [Zavarzinella formosa]